MSNKHISTVLSQSDFITIRQALEAVFDFIDRLPEDLDDQLPHSNALSGAPYYESRPLAALAEVTNFLSAITVAAAKDGYPCTLELQEQLAKNRR